MSSSTSPPSKRKIWVANWSVVKDSILFNHHSVISYKPFSGYKREIEVGTTIAKRAFEEKRISSCLAFGMAGTGKSAFAYQVTLALNQKHKLPFSLLHISCESLASRASDATTVKSDLNKTIFYVKQYRPIVVVFDELDALAPDRVKSESRYREVNHWLMDRLAQGFEEPISREGQVMVIGVTNDPAGIDSAVVSRLGSPIYFVLPNDEVAIGIMGIFKIPNPEAVWKNLLALLEDDRIDGRGLFKACSEVRSIFGDLSKESSSTIAEGIYANASRVIPRSEREDYERKNESLIKQSQAVLRFWSGLKT